MQHRNNELSSLFSPAFVFNSSSSLHHILSFSPHTHIHIYHHNQQQHTLAHLLNMVRTESTFSIQQCRRRRRRRCSAPPRWPTCSLVGVRPSSAVVGLCSMLVVVASCVLLLLNCMHCEAVSLREEHHARRAHRTSTPEELTSGDVDGHEAHLGLDDDQLSQLHPSTHVYTNQFVVESSHEPARVQELAEEHGFNYLGHVSRHFFVFCLSFPFSLFCGS